MASELETMLKKLAEQLRVASLRLREGTKGLRGRELRGVCRDVAAGLDLDAYKIEEAAKRLEGKEATHGR